MKIVGDNIAGGRFRLDYDSGGVPDQFMEGNIIIDEILLPPDVHGYLRVWKDGFLPFAMSVEEYPGTEAITIWLIPEDGVVLGTESMSHIVVDDHTRITFEDETKSKPKPREVARGRRLIKF